MDLCLNGKVAWVVGGSEGIGYECVRSLMAEGVRVAVSSRSETKMASASESIEKKLGKRPLTIQADASDHQKMQEVLCQIVKQLGRLDILIYVAGISNHGKLMDVEPETWRKNWELNVVSFFHAVRIVVPEIKKQVSGSIIVLGASSGKQPTPNQLISNTTKGSLIPMVKTLAGELAEYNIVINNVCPGRFLTPRRWHLAEREHEQRGISAEDYFHEVASTVPLKRLGEPEEIADFITFLTSSKASYITGQSISVDGGLVRSII